MFDNYSRNSITKDDTTVDWLRKRDHRSFLFTGKWETTSPGY